MGLQKITQHRITSSENSVFRKCNFSLLLGAWFVARFAFTTRTRFILLLHWSGKSFLLVIKYTPSPEIKYLPVVDIMCMQPNGRMRNGNVGIGFSLCRIRIKRGKLPNCLINCHIVRKYMISNQKLEFMSRRTVSDRYRALEQNLISRLNATNQDFSYQSIVNVFVRVFIV